MNTQVIVFYALAQGDVAAVDQIEDAIRTNRIDSGDLKRLNPFAGAHVWLLVSYKLAAMTHFRLSINLNCYLVFVQAQTRTTGSGRLMSVS